MSGHYSNYILVNLPPISDSDHDAQLLTLGSVPVCTDNKYTCYINYESVANLFISTDWHYTFAGCTTADDFAIVFTELLYNIGGNPTSYKQVCHRHRLPRHIVKLIHRKKCAWTTAKRAGDFSKFKQQSRTARSAIRQHRRCIKNRLIYSRNRKAFFHHMSTITSGMHREKISLCVNDVILSEADAAESFLHEFLRNFSSANTGPPDLRPSSVSISSNIIHLNCTAGDVISAIKSCSNNNSSPDDISFRLIKMVAQYIIYPVTVIFQHSLFERLFPAALKHAIVVVFLDWHNNIYIATDTFF